MNQVTVTDEAVKISLNGLNKLWAFKGQVIIQREAIEKVYIRSADIRPPWRRVAGTHIPTIYAAGTYHGLAGREFWNARFHNDCVVFDLSGYEYSRVVIDVLNAQELIAALS